MNRYVLNRIPARKDLTVKGDDTGATFDFLAVFMRLEKDPSPQWASNSRPVRDLAETAAQAVTF
jgi:hypothetical protein